MTESEQTPSWTFLTNHASVLILVASQPDIRVREMAGLIGITDRAVHRILKELEDAGYVTHKTVGRRNRYRVRPSLPFRHSLHEGTDIGVLIQLLSSRSS